MIFTFYLIFKKIDISLILTFFYFYTDLKYLASQKLYLISPYYSPCFLPLQTFDYRSQFQIFQSLNCACTSTIHCINLHYKC